MTVTVSFSPEEEAQLSHRAQAQGVPLDVIVRTAVKRLLADAPEAPEAIEPTRSMYGFLSEYGPGPSEADIDENRREMFSTFERDDIV